MSKTPFIVALVVLVAAVALNPSAERHRSEVRAAVSERSPVAGLLGVGALAAFVTTYHPLGVASYTTVADRVVSVGAFGLVYVRQPALAS